MKKIIATVLAMVMALALCTVAFADNTTTTLKDSDGYDVYGLSDKASQKTADADITKTVTGNSTASDGTVTYTAVSYTDGTHKWFEVDQSASPDAKLVNTKTGAVVAYLKNGDAATTTVVVAKYVEAKDAADQTCGDYKYNVYVDSANKVYKAGAGAYAVLNGKFVAVASTTADTAAVVEHTFDASSKITFKSNGDPDTITCSTCKKAFKVGVAKDVASMVTGYQQLSASLFKDGAPTYYAITGTSVSTTTGTTTSPKTFDAGIAMYVGMALTSVAGSAVVIGKKKEF